MKFKLPWSKKSGQSVSYTTIEASSDLAKLLGPTSKSSVVVTHKTALQASVSLACARVISQGISQVPLKVFQSRSDGGADPYLEHSLYKVLHDSPNEWQTSFEWREMTALHLVFAGNAYSHIVRGLRGAVVGLMPLLPSDITTEKVGHDIIYKLKRNGEEVPIDSENILHLRGMSWNGYDGLDGVRLAREAIGLSMATEEHGSKQFANGATIPGILTTEQSLTQDQISLLRDSFNQAQQGLANAWNIMITHGGLQYKPTGINNEQAQFTEVRKFQIEEVCRHFGVLPIMVGATDKVATYASAGQMFLAHLVHTMSPWYARLEQSFNKNLLTDADKAAGVYTKFIDGGILRGSHKERADYYNTMFNIGALNPNEIRAKEDMNPYEGGDDYRVPMNTEDPSSEEDKSVDLEIEIKKLQDQILNQQPVINVDARTSVTPQPVTVNIPDMKQPDVDVKIEPIQVNISPVNNMPEAIVNVPKQDPPNIKINVPKQAPPTVNVNLPPRKTDTLVERDKKGNIVRAKQIETDL